MLVHYFLIGYLSSRPTGISGRWAGHATHLKVMCVTHVRYQGGELKTLVFAALGSLATLSTELVNTPIE